MSMYVATPAGPTGMAKIYIIGEDMERMRPLLVALDKRKLPVEVWNTANGAWNPELPPPRGVYLNRQSPSANTRQHASSVAFARELLWWLAHHGVPVINGAAALDVEMSKARQCALLAAVGLNHPETLMCHGLPQLIAETRPIRCPVIVKPNAGGSGTGISAYSTGRDASVELKNSTSAMRSFSPDGLWVVQELEGNPDADMRSILRFEVVDGRVQRDYVVKITAPAKEYSLCPCDPRGEAMRKRMSFKILLDPLTIPGFAEHPEAFDRFCRKVEAFFRAADSKVGAVEGVVIFGEDHAAHRYPHHDEPVVFDVNVCNTNYNEGAEAAVAEVVPSFAPGVERVADMLERELRELSTTPHDELHDYHSLPHGPQ